MKIELEEKDIEIILLAHITKLFPGNWECDIGRSYSRITAEFTLKKTIIADLQQPAPYRVIDAPDT